MRPTLSRSRRTISRAATRCSTVIVGLPPPARRKPHQGKDNGKDAFSQGGWPYLSPSSSVWLASTPLPPPSAARETVSPTLMSRRKVSTAGAASSSFSNVFLRVALGCFHPQAFPTPLHSALICGAQAGAAGWSRSSHGRPHSLTITTTTPKHGVCVCCQLHLSCYLRPERPFAAAEAAPVLLLHMTRCSGD